MKQLLKRAAVLLSTLVVAPSLLSYAVRSRVFGRDRALEASSQLLGLLPGITGQYLRRAFYMRVLARCPESATIEFGVLFSSAGAILEEDVYVGPRCHLGLVHIGRGVLIGAGVHIPSGAAIHPFESPDLSMREQPLVRQLVRVGAGSWIGSAAVVMADVGEDTIVGAGAVVTRPLPGQVIAAGVPARVLRTRVPSGS